MKSELPRLVINGRGQEKVVYPDRSTPTPPNIVRPELTSYKDALAWNKHAQEVHDKMSDLNQDYAIVRADPVDSNAVLVVNVSDLHWGHQDVNYDFLDHGLDVIEHTPNVYALLGWNLLDSAIASQFPDGVSNSGQTAQEQVYTFRDKLQQLHQAGKLLASIGSGACHEGWMKKRAGWQIYRELFEDIDIPLVSNGACVDVQVGSETYRIGLAHKLRYWSTLNETHGGLRMLDRIADADIAFTSHMHRGAISQTSRFNPPFRKEVGIVASGTCKLKDEWLRDLTGEEGKPGFQGVMLWGDHPNFQVVHDIDTGRELAVNALKSKEAKDLQKVRDELIAMQMKQVDVALKTRA